MRRGREIIGNNLMFGAPAALLVGVGLRLWFYLLNDGFWRDETMLLLNVARKSCWELTGRLDYAQACPIPVLWWYRALSLLQWGGELPMRAMSLAASLLSLLLFYRLARMAQVHEKGILFSTWLLALSPGAIFLAAQAKPYALDLLVAVGFFLLAVPWFIGSDAGKRTPLLFWYGGVAPWFSFPALFVAGGVAGGLLLNARRRGWRPALVLLAVIGLSFGLKYLIVIRHNLSLREYVAFADLESLAGLQVAWNTPVLAYDPFLASLAAYPLWFSALGAVIACLLGVGLWEAGRKYGRGWAAALILPLLIALTASVLQYYPIYARCYLFAVPGLLLLAGYAVAYLFKIFSRPKLVAGCLITVLAGCCISTMMTLGRPSTGVREGLRFILQHYQQDDLVTCDAYALPTLMYYQLTGLYGAAALQCDLEPLDRFAWGRCNPYNLTCEKIMPLIPRRGRIWCLAEADGYARDSHREVLSYWQELTRRLSLNRRPLASYRADRVEVQGFSGGARP